MVEICTEHYDGASCQCIEKSEWIGPPGSGCDKVEICLMCNIMNVKPVVTKKEHAVTKLESTAEVHAKPPFLHMAWHAG